MTFQQIKYVLEIARCGSISKATKNLFVAQPYLSNLLKELEAEIGITIFIRNSKGVELTDAGKEFIGYVKPLLEQREKILEMYSSQKFSPTFHFSVSLQHFPFVIKSFVEFFYSKKPEKYELHVREVGMYRVISDVFDKKSDIGIIYISDMTERFIKKVLSSKKLEFHEIARITPCVFFNKNHPMANKEQIEIREMQEYPFISFEREAFAALDYSEEVILRGFAPTQKSIYIEDRATIINLLTHTDAFSIGSGILPHGYQDQEIISRPIAHYEGYVKLGYITHASTVLNDDLHEFIDSVRRNIPD
ncbi:LysR family transcriptional regulator [Anaeroselena agilis]|uniref:LysR family transcriptional regulator n=1 Tax=Anaeroselena agilis TaxID=3063788 RepID=A0ABU3NZ02_9FIRM|nr:LysR family transcriptional regulator [Selenomonadales bacterium 4137-cl]